MGRNNNPRYINNIPYTSKKKLLGLKFVSYSYGAQANKNKLVAEQHLSKLRKFSGLSQYNKLKIYKTTIIPALTYPAVLLNSLTFPANYKYHKTKPSDSSQMQIHTNNHYLHRICNIDPITSPFTNMPNIRGIR